jgi:hypothetical protein
MLAFRDKRTGPLFRVAIGVLCVLCTLAGGPSLASAATITDAAANRASAGDAQAHSDHLATNEGPAEEDDPQQPSLTVAPAEPVLETSSESFAFTVDIANPSDSPLPGGTVSVELARERVQSADGLDAKFPDSGTFLGQVEVSATPAGNTRTETVTVPRDEVPLGGETDAGIYLVQASYHAAKEQKSANDPELPSRLSATSPVIWHGINSSQPLKVSTVVPLVLPDKIWSLPTQSQLNSLFADGSSLWQLLTVAEKSRATLAIDPRILVGIRAFGADAPKNAQKYLQRLENSQLKSFVLEFGDADLAAQSELNTERPLRPRGASFVTRVGSSADATELSESDTSSEDSGTEGAKPDTDERAERNAQELDDLAKWDETALFDTWPASGDVTTKTLQLVKNSGYSGMLLADSNVSAENGPRASLDGLDAVITDSGINTELRNAASAETDGARQHAAAAVYAQLALKKASSSSGGIVMSLDRNVAANTDEPTELLDELIGEDWLNFVPVGDQPKGKASLRSSEVDPERVKLLRAAREREQTVARAGDALAHPEYLTDYQRFRLLSLFATHWSTTPHEFAETAEDFRVRDADLMSGVQVIGSSLTQVFGSSSRIPVQLRNSLPFDAVVAGTFEPANGAITVDKPEVSQIEIPAGETTTILVPIHSRVTSGDSGIIVTLLPQDRSQTISTQTFDVSISSQVETIAIVVLSLAAMTFVGFGVWRSVRHRRRQTHDAAQAPSETEDQG